MPKLMIDAPDLLARLWAGLERSEGQGLEHFARGLGRSGMQFGTCVRPCVGPRDCH